jgi:hypothetical protein
MSPQPPPQGQPQIHPAELAQPLHPHPAHIHWVPPRGCGWRWTQFQWLGRRRAFQQSVQILPPSGGAHLRSVQLAQAGHDLMPRAAGRADRSDQRPILVSLAAGLFAMTPQEHAPSITPPGGLPQRAVRHYIVRRLRLQKTIPSGQLLAQVTTPQKNALALPMTNFG